MSETPDELPAARPQIRDRYTFLIVIASTFGLQAFTLVTGVIIARALGPEGRGIVALVFALSVFASQLTFGASVPVAITRQLAERGIGLRDGLRGLARRRGGLLLVPSLAAGAIMLVLLQDEPTGDRVMFAVAAALMALQTMVFRLLSGGLQGEGRLAQVAWAGMLPQLLFTVALVTAQVAGWGWQALDMLVAYFVSSFIALAFAARSLGPASGRDADRLDETALWAESRRSYISSVRPLDGLQLDRLVVGGFVGTVALGLYAAASAVSNLCSLVSNAVAIIVLPRVAAQPGNRSAQQAVIRRWVLLSAALIGVIVVGLQLVVDPVIRIAFGEEFTGAITCARWLILADGLMAMRKVLIAVLQGQGRGGTASWIELGLLPVMIGGTVVAALLGSLTEIGIALTVVGLLSCLALGRAVRQPYQPVRPPSTTRT